MEDTHHVVVTYRSGRQRVEQFATADGAESFYDYATLQVLDKVASVQHYVMRATLVDEWRA